jgi:hypothetical protein
VVLTAIGYQVGIHQYTQVLDGKLTDASLTRTSEDNSAKSGGGSSGCDAGFGAFALLAAAGAVALSKKS